MITLYLNQNELELIVRVFRNEISEQPLGIKRFRVANSDQMEILSQLESNNYIKNTGEVYHLKIESLMLISKMEQTAAHFLDQMKPIFNLLQQTYRNNPDSSLFLHVIENQLRYSRKLILRYADFLSDLPIMGGKSIAIDFEDASLCPSENILKYSGLEEAINTVAGWRNPPKAPKGAIDFFPLKRSGDFSYLLHPRISETSLKLYQDGHLREAVLNSMMALFDSIRQKTGLQEDGDRLVSSALSLEQPYLILTELDTESGRNDQKGFMQIFKGAYQGIRNPKAHSLEHDLTDQKAAQYLVFASLLMRRIDEAQVIDRS